MTLPKAIELVERSLVDRKICYTKDYFDAAKLLIEVGNFIELCRIGEPQSVPELFHGETED